MRFVNFLIEGKETSKVNIAKVPLSKAKTFAEEKFSKADKSLNEVLPDFDTNYILVQKATKKALDVPRIEMPVIEPEDMHQFDRDLKSGKVDIFRPYARGKLHAPKSFRTKDEKEEWITLGFADGKISDDKIKGIWTTIPAKNLIPTQSQIWLDKVLDKIIKFGKPAPGSHITGLTIIVSKEGYILDGHHRYGQVMLVDPNIKLAALKLPIDIKTLLKVGRTYGTYLGREQKA